MDFLKLKFDIFKVEACFLLDKLKNTIEKLKNIFKKKV